VSVHFCSRVFRRCLPLRSHSSYIRLKNSRIIDEIAFPPRLGPRDFITRPSVEMKMPCQKRRTEKCGRTKICRLQGAACRCRERSSQSVGSALLRIRCMRACQTSSWPTEEKLSVGKGRTVWQGFYRMRAESCLVRGMPERSLEHAPDPGSYSRGSQGLSCAHRHQLWRVLRSFQSPGQAVDWS